MSKQNILEIRGLCKSFALTKANVDIDFSLKRGEIKGLIGENGSGKSTLLSQIAGIYSYDSGEMFLDEKPYMPASPVEANKAKISMVTQELGVVDTLPAAVNMYLGRLDQFTRGGVVNVRKLMNAALQVFDEWDLPYIPLGTMMTDMSIEERKIVELARALSVEPDILLLDEITQSLSLNNREHLYSLINKLKERGKSVIVITHDIDEMLEISDSTTILRDGQVVGDVETKKTNADKIRYMMVGREISGDYYRADNQVLHEEQVVLDAQNISVEEELEEISFQVHKGEILGFAGLSDSGIRSVGRALYGLSKCKTGSITVDGEPISNAQVALASNMAYVPKDRDNEALMINATIHDNLTLPSLDNLKGPLGFLSPKRLGKLSNKMVDSLSVKCVSTRQDVGALSGGNKQKVNLGRWLAKDPKVLILDCPTRGVDVGVKAYIYSIMKQAKEQGIATVLISDELTEILGMADRLIVMKDGRMTKMIRRNEDFTEQSVIGEMI